MKYTRYRSVPSLRTGQSHQAGRNSTGHITVRHRGGGHKQAFRSIDWNRSRAKALVVSFEYDPQRNASLAKLYHPKSVQSTPSQSTYSYIIASTGLKLFQEVYSYNNKQVTTPSPDNSATVAKLLLPGDSAPISFFEPGDFIHAVEAFPGQGAVFGRSSGSFCQVMSLQQDSALLNTENTATNFAKVRLPSGSQRLINFGASATLGVPTSRDNPKKNLKKAGRSR